MYSGMLFILFIHHSQSVRNLTHCYFFLSSIFKFGEFFKGAFGGDPLNFSISQAKCSQ